ncbi:WD domain, G-beta repeat-containing protein [Toxoplasma gondii TgCatPRC2]|uniref:WD domain, G-beta repeat-containing protein n=1 Tax=Toxoplasma gondii TgCatPRC2 TaxID=1130821 RepID=A0A151HNS1_TOXGO|nr:WD domain, G-beta repeat-containing protein [Toxoplasma gondii TgCatPRC2]
MSEVTGDDSGGGCVSSVDSGEERHLPRDHTPSTDGLSPGSFVWSGTPEQTKSNSVELSRGITPSRLFAAEGSHSLPFFGTPEDKGTADHATATMHTTTCNGTAASAGDPRNGHAGAQEDSSEATYDDVQNEKRWRGFSRREVVTLILQCMAELGYRNSVKALEEESGFLLEDPSVAVLHEAVLQGNWTDVYVHLKALPLRPQVRKACWFLAMEQKYFETLANSREEEVIRCLRDDLQPAVFDSSTSRRLQACSALLMHADPGGVLENMSVLSDTLRSNLWMRLKHLLPPTVSPPSSRLAVLLAYALQHQTLMCLFHNTNTPLESYSLLHDHHCHHYDPCSLSLPLSRPERLPAPGTSTESQLGMQVDGDAATLEHGVTHHASAVDAEGRRLLCQETGSRGGECATLGGEAIASEAFTAGTAEAALPSAGTERPETRPSVARGYEEEVWDTDALAGCVPWRTSVDTSSGGRCLGSAASTFTPGPVCGRNSLPVHLDQSLETHTDEVWVVVASPVTATFFASGSKDRSVAVWSVQAKDLRRSHRARSPVLGGEGGGRDAEDAKLSLSQKTETEKASCHRPYARSTTSHLRPPDSRQPRLYSLQTADPSSRERNSEGRDATRPNVVASRFDQEEAETEVACVMLWQAYGHEDAVAYIAWSPDETLLASGGQDGSVCVWNREQGRTPLARINAHAQAVTAVGWLRNGNSFVSGGSDKTVAMCSLVHGDGASGERGWRITCDFTWDLRCRVQDLVVLRDGCTVVCVTQDKQLRLLDTKNRVEILSIPFTEVIYSVCASALSNQILINFADARPVIRLWDTDEHRSVQRYRGHKQGCYVIRSTFGGVNEAFVVSGSEDSQVYIWHRFYGSLLYVLSGHASTVNAVAWPYLSGGLWMISASDDHVILFWHVRRQNRPSRLKEDENVVDVGLNGGNEQKRSQSLGRGDGGCSVGEAYPGSRNDREASFTTGVTERGGATEDMDTSAD